MAFNAVTDSPTQFGLNVVIDRHRVTLTTVLRQCTTEGARGDRKRVQREKNAIERIKKTQPLDEKSTCPPAFFFSSLRESYLVFNRALWCQVPVPSGSAIVKPRVTLPPGGGCS